jgi:hypothetical protein
MTATADQIAEALADVVEPDPEYATRFIWVYNGVRQYLRVNHAETASMSDVKRVIRAVGIRVTFPPDLKTDQQAVYGVRLSTRYSPPKIETLDGFKRRRAMGYGGAEDPRVSY